MYILEGTDFPEVRAQAAQLKGLLERVREEKTSLQVKETY
jgi:hypothetical protein